VDFGFGKPKKVEMVRIAKTPGTVSLSKSGMDGEGLRICDQSSSALGWNGEL
jgi:hypothetical protein